jgi:hypothetical protein
MVFLQSIDGLEKSMELENSQRAHILSPIALGNIPLIESLNTAAQIHLWFPTEQLK